MKVFQNIDQLPAFKNAVITIGTFDGVHQGHRQIIKQVLKEAAAISGTPVLITFYPHPKQVVASSKKPIAVLNTIEEKYKLLQAAGISNIVVIPFTAEFAEQSAIQYIRDFLVAKFKPHTIIIGYDHRFGKNRSGDYKLLEKEAAQYNYVVKEIPEHVLQDVTISSTKIRHALAEGDIDTGTEFLGYYYFFNGKVIAGNKLGRTIGYPTANLQVDDEQKLIPGNGVYAVIINIEGGLEEYKGMMNIGIRPTVNGTKRVIEVNIFDFDEMIYEKTLTVSLVKRLRSEEKFNSLDDLKEQLEKDKLNALQAFTSIL